MREFRKPKEKTRKKWYLILLEFLFPDWGGDDENDGFDGHTRRIQKRRRKSMFDRY